MSEFKTIRGGWRNVPKHLYTKTQLKELGRKPSGEPVAEVWSYKSWVMLYDIKDSVEKKKATEKQLKALEKARQKREENLKCDQCDSIQSHKKYMVYLTNEKLCEWCYENRMLEARFREMHEEGKDIFKSWYDKDFVILDTETTGLHWGSEIVEISIIDKHGNTLFDSLIKPKYKIPNEVIEIHGITNESVEKSPTFKEVFPKIMEVLRDKLVLIFNSDYDTMILNSSASLWGIDEIEYKFKVECVMKAFALYEGSEKWISLENACGKYTSHRSLSDCIDTLKVIKKVWKEVGLE